MDLFSVLLTKFQLIQLCSFCSAVISYITGSDLFRANVRPCARWNIVLFPYNLTVACHIQGGPKK